MRIRQIKIDNWRHFENITIDIDQDTALVCVVGANGTGKSHLLELIAACAHRLGLSRGIEIPRGDPFADPHKFSLQFYLAPGVSQAIDEAIAKEPAYTTWDRTLRIESQRLQEHHTVVITAGGIADTKWSANLGGHITKGLQNTKDVNFLSLDANRAYPRRNVDSRDVAQAYDIDWEDIEYTRGRSFKTSATLYDEWIKYFLAQENQSGTRLIQETRKARKRGEITPEFVDHFEDYASALLKVLPHVQFTGVDPKKRTLLFDTTGLQLSFDQLSGGEREIAFLIGQIDRFHLREGLFLIDEPELHLNADLIRTWVAYLTSNIAVGQIWLATHSLEAVEAAGQKATFVLERDETTRKVTQANRLDTRPVLSVLSRAVGTPAFSITQLRFIFVEGQEGVGERERFRRLTGASDKARFIECGSCEEVTRRVLAVKSIAAESGVSIRIGGVVDKDFRSAGDIAKLESATGVHVLPVLEVENLLLEPRTINALIAQNGKTRIDASALVRDLADARSGGWIFQYAMATPNAKDLPDMPTPAKEAAKKATWVQFAADRNGTIKSLVDATGFVEPAKGKYRQLLEIATKAYDAKRTERDFWKVCEGKQILQDVARRCGFADVETFQLASFAAWERDSTLIPAEVSRLRAYVAGL